MGIVQAGSGRSRAFGWPSWAIVQAAVRYRVLVDPVLRFPSRRVGQVPLPCLRDAGLLCRLEERILRLQEAACEGMSWGSTRTAVDVVDAGNCRRAIVWLRRRRRCPTFAPRCDPWRTPANQSNGRPHARRGGLLRGI